MAVAAISTVATQVATLLVDEAKYLWGVKKQVERLHRELQWMQSFLEEADARQADDKRVRQWVIEIRDIAYDVEDVIDIFSLKIASKRKQGCANGIKRCACIFKEAYLLHKIKSQMEEITDRINLATRRLETYGIKQLRNGEGSSSRLREQRRPYPHLREDYVVGLDDQIQKLVSALVDDEKDFRAVFVCGMGGIGKTTLAKKVYHHPRVRGHFDYFVWIYVSQQCDNKNVWAKMLSCLDPEFDPKDMLLRPVDPEELAARLHNLLREKKCLVILDDIWSTPDLESLKPGFPMEETQSKFVLTSRNKELALHIHQKVHLHELHYLSDEDSWDLLHKVAFSGRNSTDQNIDARMEELGKRIAGRCKRLPLAIITIGGILATKDNKYKDWKEVHDNVKSYFRKGDVYTISDALALSYNDLPPHLKPCFLYLAHFPEDYEIPVEKLIHLWVAEGLVPPEAEADGRETREDIAESYLIELLNRCMVQVGKRSANLNIKTCLMHDLMRDFCLSKAKEENFLYVIEQGMDINSSVALTMVGSVRRLSINTSNMIQQVKHHRLRSLLFFRPLVFEENMENLPKDSLIEKAFKYIDKPKSEKIWTSVLLLAIIYFLLLHGIQKSMSYLFDNFKQLKVLDLEGGSPIVACNLPKRIGNLIHLRYLCLSKMVLCKMSSSLGELRYLQTLDLRLHHESFAIKVPNVIWKMEQLRHLYLPKECHFKTKLTLGNLKNLQTLVNFPTNNCNVGELAKLTNLRKLTMRGFRDFEDKYDRCFANICWGCCSCDLPDVRDSSNYLGIKQDSLTMLGGLPKLRILALKRGAFAGNEMVCFAESFPQLESLTLDFLPELEELKVEQGGLPSLRHLKIKSCSKMKTLPVTLSSNSSLQKVDIVDMPMGFDRSSVSRFAQ